MPKYKLFGVILEASSKQDAVIKWKKAGSLISEIKESSSYKNIDSSALGAIDAVSELANTAIERDIVVKMLAQIVEDQQNVKKQLISDLLNAVLKNENKN